MKIFQKVLSWVLCCIAGLASGAGLQRVPVILRQAWRPWKHVAH